MGHLSKSHKGSSTKLHRAHAVGHVRHPHPRVPSYGKGLHKLSKLNPAEAGDGTGHARNHTRSASHSPTGSPTTQHVKRNSSQIKLPRIGSTSSMKKNASNIAMTKLVNQPQSEKAQTKISVRRNGTDDVVSKGTVNFLVGDEQEEEWEEASNSQSPHTTRHSSVGRKTPQLEDPPSPDEPPARSPPNLPHSPPESPPLNPSAFIDHTKENSHQQPSKYSHPLDGDEVSHRLLDRNKSRPDAKMSNIFATITPNGSTGSPAFSHNHDPNFAKEPSMPADGISRFLSGTGSSSGSATPDSISHLQSALVHRPKDLSSTHLPASPAEPPTTAKPDARRVKSAANLNHPRLNNGESSSSVSPSKSEKSSTKSLVKPRVSPYESARGADPTAGKSLTQLKLDLQRLSTLHDTPSSSHPLLYQHGSAMGVQNLNAGSGEMAARLARQYHQAGMEYRNARRFHADLLVSQRLGKKAADAKRRAVAAGMKGKGGKTPVTVTPVGSSGDTRGGRSVVRFEVGRGSGVSAGEVGGRDGEGSVEGEGEGEGVQGLLRRMWEHQGEEGAVGED